MTDAVCQSLRKKSYLGAWHCQARMVYMSLPKSFGASRNLLFVKIAVSTILLMFLLLGNYKLVSCGQHAACDPLKD